MLRDLSIARIENQAIYPDDIQDICIDMELYSSYLAGIISNILSFSHNDTNAILFLSQRVYFDGCWLNENGDAKEISSYPELVQFASLLERIRCRLFSYLS
jgi:hypothetical protein